jgi:polar amino acid transport system substrate-binding protein
LKRYPLAAFLLLACAYAAASLTHEVVAQAPPQGQSETLQVVIMPLEPFVIEDGDRLSGFSIDLWNAIAELLDVQYQWVKVETVDDLLAAIQDGQADVGIAGISMTPEREQIVDFSLPIFNAGLRVMTATRSGPSVPALIGIIFSPAMLRVFGLGLLILLLTAHIIWLTERGSNAAIPRAYLPGIWESLWWSLATLSTQVYGVLGETRSWFRRLLAMILVVISIVLIAQFTASITAVLTVHQLSGTIHGASDLPGKRIATVRGTTGAAYLAGQHLRPVEVERIDDAYPLLEASKVDAIVFDAPVLLYYAVTRGKGAVQVVGPTLKDEYYGIALPAGDPLRKPINEALLELMQNGIYTEIHNKWFGTN